MSRVRVVVGLMVVAASVCAVLQPPAAADPAPEAARFTRRSAQRNVAVGATAELRVACPAGTSVVGGGVDVEGGNTFTWIHASYPYDGPDADTRPDDGWAGAIVNGATSQRRMSTSATCATSGTFTYLQASSFVVAGGETSRAVICPSTGRVIGGGGQILQSSSPAAVSMVSNLNIDASDPDAFADDWWVVDVRHRAAAPAQVGFKVFVICETGASRSALRFAETRANVAGGSAATPALVASCPSGTMAVGGGASLSAPRRDGESLHSLGPADGPDAGVTADDAWYSRASAQSINSLTTTVICSR